MTSTTAALPSGRVDLRLLWKPLVLALYCATLAIVAYHHEPWVDEAQAWLLARDASLPDLFLRYLRLEGTSGLWHALLMPFAKLGLPYWTLRLLTALIATIAAGLVLWLGPFPPVIRAVIPFTYFLLYQYAVVARSYVLLAPLLFVIAWLLPRARQKPGILIALLILLANVSIHGTLAAVGILAAYSMEVWTDSQSSKRAAARRLMICWGVLLLALIALAIELWPTAKHPFLYHAIGATNFSQRLHRGFKQLSEAFSIRLRYAVLPLTMSLFWMARNRMALYFVLPAALVLAFSSQVYSALWHSGILFLLWLFAMWIAGNRSSSTTPRYVWAVWLVMLAPQIFWAAWASIQDIQSPYSGSKALAENIAPDVAAGKRIAGAGGALLTELQPYFQRNIFENYHDGHKPAFWLFKPKDLSGSPASLASQHPDLIVVSLAELQPSEQEQLIHSLSDAGYGAIREYPGGMVWKSITPLNDSFLVARRSAAPGSPQN